MLDRDCIESVDCFGSYSHFHSVDFSNPQTWYISPFVCVIFVSFINVLYFCIYRSFVSLGKFIPKYFILFVAMVNGIFSLVSLSDFSLLVYRNARDFCALNLCLESESDVAQLCPTFSDPMGFSLPGSPVHGIFQARVLEWVAISFSNA